MYPTDIAYPSTGSGQRLTARHLRVTFGFSTDIQSQRDFSVYI